MAVADSASDNRYYGGDDAQQQEYRQKDEQLIYSVDECK
jgi:hypothetical protein